MKAEIKLADGTIYEGTFETRQSAGEGEIVFYTGMTGYQEVLTDPSYKGQIVVFTYPLIGQYGIEDNASESKQIQVSGIVMQTLVEEDKGGFKDWLESSGVPVVSGVDTRALVRSIRQGGDQWAVIDSKAEGNPEGTLGGVISRVTTNKMIVHESMNKKGTIVCIDYGVKASMIAALNARGFSVVQVPYDTPRRVIEQLNPDGLLFSNGPGDPAQMSAHLDDVKELALRYPTLGICMGHQVIATAFGCTVSKQRYGHRGANHPVRHVKTGEIWLTSQNHGYVIDSESVNLSPLEVLYENVNDGSIEGLRHPHERIVTVQFHPEASPGPKEAMAIFDVFEGMIKKEVQHVS
ncbi:carbamoyl phosphate synthase small subunit [Exiguobacterium flavidum]|uniref:carbamoyl phosphate synthase small subunit n=1 Tax=Exiguobacterium flavidum TaxID=2184695 RepID=UPI000DF75704|nr:carbamoyl phosphate synthase small subunit [Exiguobacterium flavidum]